MATEMAFDGGARLGSSLHDEGKPLDVQPWLGAVQIGQKMSRKMAAFLFFFFDKVLSR